MSILACHWLATGTKESLLEEYPEIFKNGEFRVGWLEHNLRDTALVTMLTPTPEEEDPEVPEYLLQVWNLTNVRAQVSQLLGLPIYR